MNEEQASIVIELAKEFMHLAQTAYPRSDKGYFRFSSDGSKMGSVASFVVKTEATLVDPFSHQSFFRIMNNKFEELMLSLGKNRLTAVLIIDSEFNYDIKFEYVDLDRWAITKLNGESGIPQL